MGTEAEPPVKTDDSLRSDPGDGFDLVFTKNNPPFGKRSSGRVRGVRVGKGFSRDNHQIARENPLNRR